MRKGGTLIESILLIPMLVLLLVVGVELAKITLTYYTLQKALRGAARMVSLLRGANFCDAEDPQILAIKNFIVFGPEGTNEPIVRGLTPDRVLITPERSDLDNGTVDTCPCTSGSGCLISEGGRAPDFVVLTIDGGYEFQPHIPFRTLDPILLRPHVRVPFGGQ